MNAYVHTYMEASGRNLADSNPQVHHGYHTTTLCTHLTLKGNIYFWLQATGLLYKQIVDLFQP